MAIRGSARPLGTAGVDLRSLEGRAMARFRHQLTELVGGDPDGAQHALIERACWLQLHIGRMDNVAAQAGSLADTRTYLTFNTALSRILLALSPKGAAPVLPPSPHDLFADVG